MNTIRLPGQRGVAKITLLFVALIVVAAAAAAIGMRGRPVETLAAPAAAPVLEFLPQDLYTVEALRLERRLSLTGTLVPRAEATVKARVAGELAEYSVREGEAVHKGQALGRIDAADLQARVNARAADLEAARAQVVLAAKNRATQQALLAQRFISQNAFDSTQSGFDVAVARQTSAESELALARKSLGDTRLEAPLSGIVAERIAQPGERIAIDGRVLRIVDITSLELEAAVPTSDISLVKKGQRVSLRVDGFGEREFAGLIERINPGTVAGSRAVNIYAVIGNPDGALRSGMFVQGALKLDSAEAVLAIPASAIREELGTAFVYALDAGIVRKKAVRAGAADPAGRLPVLSGLSAGDRIVRANLGNLREGAQARVTPSAPSAPSAAPAAGAAAPR